MRVDEPEIDRAVQSIAAQNQISMDVLRQRLAAEGMDYARFRANLRDQMMIERMREREVYRRIQISDEEVDKILAGAARRGSTPTPRPTWRRSSSPCPRAPTRPRWPPGARASWRRWRACAAARPSTPWRARSPKTATASRAARSGCARRRGCPTSSSRPRARCSRARSPPSRCARGAGFHVLKVLERKEQPLGQVTQTRARHVLLRTSPQLTAEVAARRLAEYRRQIESGAKTLRGHRARSSARTAPPSAGGDLGWAVARASWCPSSRRR